MTAPSILDLVRVTDNARDIAVHAEAWGYRRFWIAEHHNMPGIASAATSVVIGHIAAGTKTIRVGAGGIMLPTMDEAPPYAAMALDQRTQSDPGGKRVLEAGVLAEAGKGPCQPLNPEWDAEFMEILRSGQIWRADALDTDKVREAARRGANEVLAWVAAFGAFSTGGHFTVEQEFYEAIPGWIAGMAMMAARQADATH